MSAPTRLIVEQRRWLPRAAITAGIVVVVWLAFVVFDGADMAGAAIVVGVVGGIAAGSIVVLLDASIWRERAWHRLDTVGVVTTAEVTETPTVARGPDSDSWTVRFRYSVGGLEREGVFVQGLLASDPPPMKAGDVIVVRYDPGKPQIVGWTRSEAVPEH
jgi:hypothetical protein